MSSPDPLAVLEIAARNELESMLMEFDGTWGTNSLDEYGGRVAAHPDKEYRNLALAELVKIDLQRSWSAGNGRPVEDYLGQFPVLGNAESVSADLIAAEYDARNRVDSDLTLASYESRFPKQFQQVKQLASRLLDSSGADSSPTRRTEKESVQASIDTSRADQLRDTNVGERRDAIDALPVEFGRYRILKELGSGAMGKVYLAHDSQLDRQVALKTPSFRGADDDDMVTRFYREARAAAKIHHRNICPIYDVGEIDGRHFISMAFVKGRCMSEFIKPDKLPPQRTSAILVQRLAVALGEAHKHNVIHRDLKPANIMIDLKREPIVMDFGLARQTDTESRVTQSGMAVGTPAYMSPEQVRGELDEVGAGADIYALGVILYELLTGRLPFRGPIAKVVYGIVNEEPAAPSTIREGIDTELESICAKMMAKDKGERFQSMEDVALALKAYVRGQNQTKKTETSSTGSSAAPSSKSSTKALTETGALNAFFAAQPEASASGTKIESAPQSIVARESKPDRGSVRPKASGRSNGNHRRRRNFFIASGFAGGILLLLGVVIYFNGGRVELDDDSDAVVQVDNDGNVTIRPGTEAERNTLGQERSTARVQGPVPANPGGPTDRSGINPQVELLNEWQHDGESSPNWYLASLSPDGRRVAFRIGDGPLKISDSDSKQSLQIPSDMEDAISIAFSFDGRLIATGHDNKKIRLWDAESFAPVGEPFESPIEQHVLWVHLSADGTKLIAMGNDHDKLRHTSTFYTWEVATRKLISRFQAGMDGQRWADSIDASSDGRLVAVISLRGGPTLWDTTTGQQVPVQFEVDEKLVGMMRITGMDLSADGSLLAYGTLWGSPSYAAILDTSTGKELWNSGKQKGRVHCVQFSDDGKWLASTAGHDQAHQISLWDVATGAEIERWRYQYESDLDNATAVKFLSFADDGSRLMLTGGHMPVVVWNLLEKTADYTPSASEAQLGSTGRRTRNDVRDNSPAIAADATSEQGNPTLEDSQDDRAIAERIVGFGGSVRLVDGAKWIETLPDGDVRVEGVWFFRKQRQFDNGHLALLAHLPELRTVFFSANKMSDEGFATLAEMENVVENVKDLRFLQAAFGPKGLAALAKLKRLKVLALWHTELINDDLKLLANLPALKELTLQQYSKKKFGPAFLSEDCLSHLTTVSGLQKLTLIGEPFADAGLVTIAELKIQELWLATPNVTDLAITQLREQRPRLGITRFKWLSGPETTDQNTIDSHLEMHNTDEND